MYTVRDLSSPVVVYEGDAGWNILEKAITNTFHEDLPYACLDDIPYVEYNPETGLVEIDNEIYVVDKFLQEYLDDARRQLETIPLPQIKLGSVDLEITPPENEGEKGSIRIENYRPVL